MTKYILKIINFKMYQYKYTLSKLFKMLFFSFFFLATIEFAFIVSIIDFSFHY